MERAEKIGLGVATAGHVLLFGLLSTAFLSKPDPLKLRSPPMDITMVDDVALRSAAPEISTTPPPPSEAPEKGPVAEAAPSTPAPPEPKAAPPEPAPPVKVTPAPAPAPSKPLPKPLPATRPVERAKPKPAAPPKPVAAKHAPARPAPAKAAQARPTQSRTPLKLALDKPAASGQGKAAQSRGSKLGPNFLQGIESDAPAPRAANPAPAASVLGPREKAAIDAEIRRQLKPYWKAPTGADSDQLRTELRVRLAKDGSVVGTPEVVRQTGITASNKAQAALHAELAIKAVRLASPFNLPPQFYEDWKLLEPLGFDRRLSQ